MTKHCLLGLALVALQVLPSSSALRAQESHQWWAELGLGGSNLSCELCAGSTADLSGRLAVGSRLGDRVSLEGSVNGSFARYPGGVGSPVLVALGVRIYWFSGRRFHTRIGLGGGWADVHRDAWERSGGLLGGTVGVGYDFSVSDRWRVAPFYAVTSLAGDGGEGATYLELGLSTTFGF